MDRRDAGLSDQEMPADVVANPLEIAQIELLRRADAIGPTVFLRLIEHD